MEELLHVNTSEAPIGQRCSFWTGQVAAHLSNMRIDVGRKLDFLAQEFNREANTLGSKSVDAEVSQAALELKVLIEQMREQVQNLE